MFIKRIFCFWIVFFFGIGILNAQNNHFVYLQTETFEPFYVILNKKNISSSSAGHLILSRLSPGNYNIQVGFPKDNSLQDYFLDVLDSDQGFILKKTDHNGFAIVNLLTKAVQYNGQVRQEKAEAEQKIANQEAKRKLDEEEAKKLAEEQIKQKAVADSLAQIPSQQTKTEQSEPLERPAIDSTPVMAAKTSSTPEKQLQGAEKTAPLPTQGVPNKDLNATPNSGGGAALGVVAAGGVIATATSGSGKKEEPLPNTTPDQTMLSASEIAKLQEEARRIDASGKRDSVLAVNKKSPTDKPTNQAFLDMEMTIPDSSHQKEAPKFEGVASGKTATDSLQKSGTVLPIIAPVENIKPVVDTKDSAVIKSNAVPVKANPNCTEVATDAELELIAQLAKREKDPEDGLDMLKKTFKIKCVHTQQVRKLCLQFIAEQHRYDLLDMAYRYTIDKENYSQLSDLLTDIYYVNRFKAMIQ